MTGRHRGVWQHLHRVLLSRLRKAERIDWNRAIIGSTSVRATHRGENTGRNPTDRAKRGTKQHVLIEAHGIVLSQIVTAANRHDVTALIPVVDAIPRVGGRIGAPRSRPKSLYADL